VKLLKKRGHRGVAALGAATFAVMGLSQVSASASSTMTLTEIDYFSTVGQLRALNAYVKQFDAAHPGVKVILSHSPFASFDTKLLTDASAHDLPNIVMSDNPFVPDMIATGEILPLSGFKGFSAAGYYKGIIDEGLSGGKYYSLPVAGSNSIALFYNIAMFKAAHLTPPKTWAQMVSDAKALTTKKVYGIALTAEPAEDTTWQWEPFLWSNGGSLANISAKPAVQALDLWTTLVKDGSASKACLTWSQTPAAMEQFMHGDAAMEINGPWNFSNLNAAGWYYGKQFGIVPVPVRVPGQKVVAPLGGEDFMVSNSGTKAEQDMAAQFIFGLQKPSEELAMAKVFGYMPPKPSVAQTFIKTAGPEWDVLADETLNAIPRANVLGVKYAKMSEAAWTAIDAAISGESVQSALDSAASQIKTILSS
jgi:multiple sugar transport system substrate-binding protein